MATINKPAIQWIGTGSVPKFYPDRRNWDGKVYKPTAIVMHIMEGTLAGTDSHFQNPSTQASTQFGLGKNGEIHQYVDLKDGAWGNGKVQNGTASILSQFPGVNPNLYTVSIEHEGKHPNMDAGQFFHFTDAQYEADIKLVAWLCQQYGIPCDREHILGHYQIDAVDRAYCPGPHYDYNRVIEGAKKLLNPTLFSDIDGHWAKAVIEKIAALKTPVGSPLISGFPDGTFGPDQPLTRAQAAVIIDRLLTYLGK